MIIQVFKANADYHQDLVLTGAAFQAEVFFPKIRNLNRLLPGHRGLTLCRTEKYDGQNIGAQRRGDCLVFYSRNGLLDLQSLGRGLDRVWGDTDWNAIHVALEEGDTLYFEAVGNHRDFDYRPDFPPDGYGLIAFALRKSSGEILDPLRLPVLPMRVVPVLETGSTPDLPTLRRLLIEGREGYVFTGYSEAGEYFAYKAKRRELLEEAEDQERETILASSDPPAVKIAKIVCTLAKVKHILQKLKDGELPVKGEGIGPDGKWDGSNAIIPTLIRAVQNDCRAEAGDTIRELQAKLNVTGKQVNRVLEDRVRAAFFELTLRESLSRADEI
jgi:hypothetical protein